MNQIVARSLNERLILSLLLQNNGMTRLELGQASGLSAQTISVIVRALEAAQLIGKGVAVKGRVGPPTRPVVLNPEGAFSIGLNVNANEVTAAVLNLVGERVAFERVSLQAVSVQALHKAITEALDQLTAQNDLKISDRLIGVGLTLPRANARLSISEDTLSEANLEGFVQAALNQDVHIQDEMTALISAEAMFGATRLASDYLECFVDSCIHMRLCLGGRVYAGQTAREGQLPALDASAQEQWIDTAAQELITTIQTLARFITAPTIIIASPFNAATTEQLAECVNARIGPEQEVKPSAFGEMAMAAGAAALPFQVRFVSKMESAAE